MTVPALNPQTGYPIIFPVQLTLIPLPITANYPSYTIYPSQNLFPSGGLFLTPIL
jgi:hypothetical protein